MRRRSLGDRLSEQVLDPERDHIKLRVRAGDGERRGGGGGGRNVFGMKDCRLERSTSGSFGHSKYWVV